MSEACDEADEDGEPMGYIPPFHCGAALTEERKKTKEKEEKEKEKKNRIQVTQSNKIKELLNPIQQSATIDN